MHCSTAREQREVLGRHHRLAISELFAREPQLEAQQRMYTEENGRYLPRDSGPGFVAARTGYCQGGGKHRAKFEEEYLATSAREQQHLVVVVFDSGEHDDAQRGGHRLQAKAEEKPIVDAILDHLVRLRVYLLVLNAVRSVAAARLLPRHSPLLPTCLANCETRRDKLSRVGYVNSARLC